MMLSCLVKQYIKKSEKEKNLTYLKDIEDILEKETQEYVTSKHIVFSWLWDGGSKVPIRRMTLSFWRHLRKMKSSYIG